MMSWKSGSLLVFMAVFFWSGQAAALSPYPDVGEAFSAEKTGSKDVAVVIAVEEYFRLPDVGGARLTGRDWMGFFQESLGVELVYDLRDQEATREAILRVAGQAAEEVSEGGTLWFVFVGHGAPAADGSDGLLVGVDAQQNIESLMARGVAQQELMALLESGSQERTVLFLDACFSGRDTEGDSLVPGLQPVLPVSQVPEVASQTVLLSAAGSDQFAGELPGVERPAFSYWMLGALRGWATSTEEVTAREALEFTRSKLRAIPERVQTPTGTGALDLVLVRGVTEEDPLPRWDGRRPAEVLLGRLEAFSEQPEERRVVGGRGLRGSGTVVAPSPVRVILDGAQELVLITAEGRFQGAEIYRVLGRDELVERYTQMELRRDRRVGAGRATALTGTALMVLGTGLYAEAYWLREVPADHPEVARCQALEPAALQENCFATERHEFLAPWRTAGVLTAVVGSAAAIFGLIWRSRAREMNVHPLNTKEIYDLAQEKNGQAWLQELEILPEWTPGEGGSAGLSLRVRW